MVTEADIHRVLETIDDPEMPISIVDLGLVEDVRVEAKGVGGLVEIDVLPTFVGCPALPMIEEEITTKVGQLDGVTNVAVRFLFEPAWSVDRISSAGRASLQEHGVTVPERSGDGQLVQIGIPVACPFCKSKSTHMESPYGPTRCRTIHYCDACKNTFEHMKRIGE